MAQALTEWNKVKLLFGADNQPDQDNANVTFDFLIRAASKLIRRETGRRFGPRQSGVTRSYVVAKGGKVYVDELFTVDDILSIEGPVGVTVDWEYAPQDENPEENLGGYIKMGGEPWPYDLARMAPEHDGFFTRNMNPPPGAPRDWSNTAIKITGNFGYEDIPDDISYLCARTVQIWWDTNIVNFSEGEESGAVEIPDRLPQSVLSALRYYRKPRLGAAVLAGV
jgi:hypothetical protein